MFRVFCRVVSYCFAFACLCLPAAAQPTAVAWSDCFEAAPAVAVGSLEIPWEPVQPGSSRAVFIGGSAELMDDGALSLVLDGQGGGSAADLVLTPGFPEAAGSFPSRFETSVQVLSANQAPGLVTTGTGMSLAVTTKGRSLTFDYTFSAGTAPEALRVTWQSTGALAATLAGEELAVSVGGETEGSRSLTLRSPRAWQETQKDPAPVSVAYRVTGDGFAFDFGEHSPDAPLFLRFQLEHSAALHVPTARAPAGEVWAAGMTRFTGETGGRAVAVRVSEDGQRVESTRLLPASAAAAGVAGLAADSTGLHVVGNRSEGGIFVGTLTTRGASTVRHLADLGDASVRGAALDSSGRLLIAAENGRTAVEGPPLAELTTRFPTGLPQELREYSLSRLTASHDRVAEVTRFEAPSLAKVTIWVDCHGNPIIGTPGGILLDCAFQELAMPEFDLDFTNGFSETAAEFGHYLLQWKQFRASYGAAGSPTPIPPPTSPIWTTVAFSPAGAAAAATPPPEGPILQSGIGPQVASELNALEANSSVFPAGDPNGGWQSGDALTLNELAVAAGLYLDKVGSPLAARLNIGGSHNAAVVTAVEYCIEGGVFTRIQDLIPDWDALSTWDPNGGNPIDVVDAAWAQTYGFPFDPDYFQVQSMTLTHWPNPNPAAMVQNESFSGAPLNSLFDPPNPGDPVATDWVADPPEDVALAPAVLEEAADRLAHQVLRPMEIEEVQLVSGKVVAAERAVDLVLTACLEPAPVEAHENPQEPTR